MASCDRGWSIRPQAINFANATIVAQLLWGAVWYVNASNTHLKVLDSIVISAYKIRMSLPRSASNKTCWAIFAQPIRCRITSFCDQFILKTIQLNKSIIVNKIKTVNNMCNSRRIRESNLPFLIQRWKKIEYLTLYIWKFHPHYEFPLRPRKGIKFDFNSGATAKDSGDLNNCFLQLINDNKLDSQEIIIFTDGSRRMLEDEVCEVGCAIVAPCLDKTYKFKLNRLSSSHTAELIVMSNAMDIALAEDWSWINVLIRWMLCLSWNRYFLPCSHLLGRIWTLRWWIYR